MRKEKDKRYKGIKTLIDNGLIKTLPEIFDMIPRSVVARDLGTNFTRFNQLINNVGRFKIEEISIMAQLFDVDELKMFHFVYDQYLSKKKRRKS